MKRRLSVPLLALIVFVVAGGVLTAGRHTAAPALPRAAAIRAALADGLLQRDLARSHWDAASADPLDGSFDRVTFTAGGRVVAEAEVSRAGLVSHVVNFRVMRVPYGDWLAYKPALLAALAALFVLVTGVAPWRRLRNLDVVAALSLLAPALVLRARYVDASVLVSVPGLAWLLGRCLWIGLGPASARRPDPAPAIPLWRVATAALPRATRLRLLRWLLAGLALIYALVSVSSNSPVDVIYAVMEGATKLAHGVLPYGHLPGDVVHGDTYPILSYALYAPLALVAPVSSDWDSVDLALGAGVVAVLAVALALVLAGRGSRPRPFGGRDAESALCAALSWLAFPPLLITASTGTTDTVLAALLVFAVLAWRRPGACAALLSAAAWFKLAPAALLPVALARPRGRDRARALAAMAAVSAPMLALVLGLGGVHGISLMAHAIGFQFSRGSPQSLWAALGITAAQPLGQAAVLALVAAAAMAAWRDSAFAADRRRVAALAAAILLGLQLTADYWAFLYVVWVVPLLCLSVLEHPQPSSEPALARAGRARLLADGAPA